MIDSSQTEPNWVQSSSWTVSHNSIFSVWWSSLRFNCSIHFFKQS